jgi:putative transposase
VFDKAYRSYGYRRMQAVLKAQHGLCLSGKTVLRLMREESRICQVRRRKYISYKGAVGLAAPNVLEQNFATDGPKQYLSPIIDLFNGEVVSYELAPSPALALVTGMLEKAFLTLGPGQKPMIHSDQGWHYRHLNYQQALKRRGLVQSMSRKGNCLDNAVAENFFGHFKEEFLRQQTFTSVSQFKTELDAYITWFNNDRIRLKLRGLSPVRYRTQSLDNLSPTLN